MSHATQHVRVIGSAVLGCVLGATVWPNWSWSLVFIFLMSCVMASAWALRTMSATNAEAVTRHKATTERAAGHDVPAEKPPVPTDGALPSPEPEPAPARDLVAPRPASWWVQPLPSARASAPKLDYVPQHSLIVQCPKCGAFDLGAEHTGLEYHFTCNCCAHSWRWKPGTAWPDVTIDPGRRQQPDRVSADGRTDHNPR